ncbi:Type IV secretory pathway%2C VirB4 components [Yersinia similis]|uniref:Type IV secretory pathway, VirB4 components n=4 Tax=Yersinia similis TaxID=367190 RepID=A0A0T9RN75_9GAMM
MVVFGPTGSGKSATLNSLFAQLMAIHRPRLFIAEAGNSFGLFVDYAAELALTVNKVSIKPGCGISLAPFADAWRLIETDIELGDETELNDRIEMDDNDDSDDEDERDILGELEIVARLMITGGEEKEEAKLERADRGMMREAILVAARAAYNEGRQMITEDLQTALYAFAHDKARPEVRRARAYNMGESLNVFMQGFLGELFNRPGQNWPEADVTLIDLGTLAREGYEAPLAVAYTSLVNTINNIAERDQFLDREIVFATDEAHMITTNPLLAPFVVKIVKMWRKLGAWLWLATQNLEDFPSTSKKMLNMIEWWLCLVMPPEEVEEIARFKKLTTEQKAMLLSATKAQYCYTEGVVLASRIEALFRAVPPSLFLALGMTEKEEKAARKALMIEHDISELAAAKLVAQKLDMARGIGLERVV